MKREADHKNHLSRWIFFLGAAVFITTCTENKPVNKEYLESEDYTSFKKRTAKEIKQNAELDKSFEWGFKQFAKCKTNRLSFPFELNFQRIGSFLENLTEDCITKRKGKNLKLLGTSSTSDRVIRWMLLEQESVYRDHELVVVIFQNQELKSFKTVGVFQKNPSRQISTDIEVEKRGDGIYISSRTHRNILYPIEQNNTVLTEYKIDAQGDIKLL